MKNNKKIVFWDWNGTIVNDSFIFVEILNSLLLKNNRPSLSIEDYRSSFCFPIDSFYKKIGLYSNKSNFAALNKDFVRLYEQKMFQPVLKRGIQKVLSSIQKNNIPQYIVSAQNQKQLDSLIKHYGLSKYFVDILGVDNVVARGKLQNAQKLKKSLVKKNDLLFFIGDTKLDFDASLLINASCLLVSWGHYNKKRLLQLSNNVFSSTKSLQEKILSQ